MISFTVYGDIQPAHRPRASVVAGHAKMRNDPRHNAWMDSVRLQALAHRPEKLLDGPLSFRATFYLLKPKSAKDRRYPHTKPDISNLVKAVEDGLNKILWTDDARIEDSVAKKRFGDPCRVEIQVEEISD